MTESENELIEFHDEINKSLNYLVKQLVKALESENIEYIDLYAYYNNITDLINKKKLIESKMINMHIMKL